MSSQRDDPDKLAHELQREADDLGERTEGLEEKVMEVRRDWDRKRSDPSVPGAVPHEHDTESEEEEAESPAPEAPPESAETNTPPTDSS